MNIKSLLSPMLVLLMCTSLLTPLCVEARTTTSLTQGWTFTKGDPGNAAQPTFDDSRWQQVTVPHDWAIYGPFDKTIDRQVVAISQNNERVATEKTGRTGALPYIGVGWYRYHLSLTPESLKQSLTLVFDGAMSRPAVYINGTLVGRWGYGYNAFYFDITPFVKSGDNVLAVRLENLEESSRWYPGAGLYRPVELVATSPVHIETWGTSITTPDIQPTYAKVRLQTTLTGLSTATPQLSASTARQSAPSSVLPALSSPSTSNTPQAPLKNASPSDAPLSLEVIVRDPQGFIVERSSTNQLIGATFDQFLQVPQPQLWSPETPHLYTATFILKRGGETLDQTVTRFGIRSISYTATNGFQLNGITRKFKGVCLHHDQGPLGTAVNEAALRRQLTILKDMGCDAIRTSHNMPATILLDLCDEMGFLVMDEAFDEWKKPKCKNGYNLLFDEWAEKDLVNFVRRDRNHPSVVMWSIGNEVPEQSYKDGSRVVRFLQDIMHREDPTRPVTAGLDRVDQAIQYQFAATLDIPGLNYRLFRYQTAYDLLPQGFILGSETASTVSSRGVYAFPAKIVKDMRYPTGQCSSYDLESLNWSNLPEEDWAWQDSKDWVIGEFVWTGFDYLGEPTPYDELWPSRSSYFGICDLAGLPKDRYYLYRSRWNTLKPTLHLLPHWTWPGREGQVTPVFVYTNYPEAELFVNGKSQGRLKKAETGMAHYRLMWNDVVYQPGTLTVVAYDAQGNKAATQTVKTASAPSRLILEADRTTLRADGNDLAFVTVSVVDKDGNPCPTASNALSFQVTGAGTYRAACNGDPTSLEPFHLPTMRLFNGKLVVVLQTNPSKTLGTLTLKVTAPNLKTATLTCTTQ